LRVFRDVIWQKLEGDKAMEPNIFGFVNDTHPATTQLLNDAVMRNGLSDERGRVRH
jgi:hypothetical protein